MQNRRPDWERRSVRAGFDVTALSLPRFPMRGREPFEGHKTRGFNQMKKKLRQFTPQNKLYYFSEKEFLGLGALYVPLQLCPRCRTYPLT